MNRFSKYFLIIIITISGILALMRSVSLQIGTSYDDAHYIILAESLSSGQGYQLINFPRPQIERAFPPGWPILLAPFTLLFPSNYSILKLFSLALGLASIFLVYKLFSKRLSSPYLEILTGFVALNPLLIGTSVTVMSESAYLFFSLLALVMFDSAGHAFSVTNKTAVYKPALHIAVAIFAFYTQLIRTVGISLIIALVIYLLLTRRFREVGITIFVFIAGTLLQLWINGTILSTGYQSQMFNSSIIEKINQVFSNFVGYYNEVLTGALIPIFGSRLDSFLENYRLQFVPLILNILILLIILWGMVISKPKLEWMHIYFIVYILAILAFWNPRVGSVKARFLIPIIPFLYFYFIQGLRWGINKLTRDNIVYTTRITVSVAGVIALLLLARNLQDWRNPIKNQMTDLSIGTNWISQNAPSDAIVMVNEPVPAYIHVQRKTIGYPNDNQDLEKYLNNQGIDYIVVSPKLQSPRTTKLDEYTEAQILPVLMSNPERFIVVYNNSEYNVTVYQYEGDINQ
ncbi:MAG: hypothetical protein H7Y59_18335 [Anaerolineales bacterium]|nr:hypothetical protein [Anaerolineales bacterium]